MNPLSNIAGEATKEIYHSLRDRLPIRYRHLYPFLVLAASILATLGAWLAYRRLTNVDTAHRPVISVENFEPIRSIPMPDTVVSVTNASFVELYGKELRIPRRAFFCKLAIGLKGVGRLDDAIIDVSTEGRPDATASRVYRSDDQWVSDVYGRERSAPRKESVNEMLARAYPRVTLEAGHNWVYISVASVGGESCFSNIALRVSSEKSRYVSPWCEFTKDRSGRWAGKTEPRTR